MIRKVLKASNRAGFEEEDQGAEEGEREEQEEEEVGEQAHSTYKKRDDLDSRIRRNFLIWMYEQARSDGGGGDVRQRGMGNIFQEGQVFSNNFFL